MKNKRNLIIIMVLFLLIFAVNGLYGIITIEEWVIRDVLIIPSIIVLFSILFLKKQIKN